MSLCSVTTLFLAALMTVQSVVPCCAINITPTDSDSAFDVNSQVAQACSCCQHPLPQQESIPSDDGHSPDGKCLFCSGFVFHSVADNSTEFVKKGFAAYASHNVSPEHKLTSDLFPILQPQVPTQQFLNLGMRLLI